MGSSLLRYIGSSWCHRHWETSVKSHPFEASRVSSEKKIDCSPSAPLPSKEASYFRTDCPSSCPVCNTLRLTRWRSMVCTRIPSLAVSNTSVQGVCVSATPNAKAIQRCPSPEYLATKGERLVRL